MRIRLLRTLVNFLSGAIWALFFISAVATFVYFFSRSSLTVAVVYTLWVGIFWLIVVVIVEVAGLQIMQYDELRRQGELLERIARRLDEKSA
jgi:hypothetical protein